MTTADTINAIANSIGSLGGLLSPMISSHSQASQQISSLSAQLNSAAASGDWQEVQQIANNILAVPGASTAVMDAARNIAKAAANAAATSAAVGSLPPAQAAALTVTNQQLVLTESQALAAQLASENSGIWNHLWHIRNLTTTGTTSTTTTA